ncbi:MAG: ribonuclease HII [Candidatus Thermoplasmatota archaeon]|jgi:ribonuclease HII|nr:ribonuclease HII [Candidatus Thermoplasmatota archaeon]
MQSCGVDEAGKGPVLGPMIIAIVSGDEDTLKKIGAKDSKALSHPSRLRIFELIKKEAGFMQWVKISSSELNREMEGETINKIEERKVSELINFSPCSKIYVDSFDVNEERLSKLLSGMTGKEVICRHRADSQFYSVSAASIVAKVIREREMDIIRKKYGNIGSGYPSDPMTVKFLEDSIKNGIDITDIVRTHWKTYLNAVNSVRQKRLP